LIRFLFAGLLLTVPLRAQPHVKVAAGGDVTPSAQWSRRRLEEHRSVVVRSRVSLSPLVLRNSPMTALKSLRGPGDVCQNAAPYKTDTS